MFVQWRNFKAKQSSDECAGVIDSLYKRQAQPVKLRTGRTRDLLKAYIDSALLLRYIISLGLLFGVIVISA